MLRLRDIMTTDVIAVAPDLTLRDAMELLSSRHISGAPVLERGHVVGVISATDLVSFAATLPGAPSARAAVPADAMELWEEAPTDDETDDLPGVTFFNEMWEDSDAEVNERFSEAEGAERNLLDEHTVAEAMTRSAYSLPPEATVEEAADLMRRKGVHRVLVVGAEELVGIVSALDIARVVADYRLTARKWVFNRKQDFDARGWQ